MTQFVLLWSQSKNTTRVVELEEMLSANRRAYTEDAAGDFVPVFIGPMGLLEKTRQSMTPTLTERSLASGSRSIQQVLVG